MPSLLKGLTDETDEPLRDTRFTRDQCEELGAVKAAYIAHRAQVKGARATSRELRKQLSIHKQRQVDVGHELIRELESKIEGARSAVKTMKFKSAGKARVPKATLIARAEKRLQELKGSV